jgi:arsenate reductase
MAELGLDLSEQFPKPLTTAAVQASDVVITMCCGDACPLLPGSATWTGTSRILPAKDAATVRRIRDAIAVRVRSLLVDVPAPKR